VLSYKHSKNQTLILVGKMMLSLYTFRELLMMKSTLALMGLFVLAPLAAAADKATIQDVLNCKSSSECPYIFDVYAGDKAFKKALNTFSKLPIAKADAKWLANGTASPSTPVTMGTTTYAIFNVCEPHNCGDNHYVISYDPTKKQVYGLKIAGLEQKKTPIGKPNPDLLALMSSYENGELAKQLNETNTKFPLMFKP
jgi:hypothetical protein